MAGFAAIGVLTVAAQAGEPDATSIVRDAVNHWRGVSSDSVMTMVIHRPDWERSMTMRAWTKGDKKSLVRVLEPRKDRGNGTLTVLAEDQPGYQDTVIDDGSKLDGLGLFEQRCCPR
jgi:hypothetical protein